MSFIILGLLIFGGVFFVVSFIWGICLLFQEPRKEDEFGKGFMLGMFFGGDQ
jgi:drug/metabolite transporter superfamily protein YnfA